MRVRLTVFYAGAFVVAGAVLIAVMYFFMGEALDRQVTTRLGITEHLQESTASDAASTQPAHDAQEALRAQFERDRDDTLDSMLIASLIALGVVGIVAGGFGWLLAGHVLQPLQQITATARRVAGRNLHERIALEGADDEVKDLADTFDAMLERLDRSFDGQRRFVANASHELRTPLAINRALIEVALNDPQADESLRRLGSSLLAVNQRHERLIDGLLTLALSEQGVTSEVQVDLADIARHVTAEARDTANASGIEIRTDLQCAPVTGDPVLLERLTQNLVDNAIRYNLPEHGQITVTTGVDDGDARLTVDNSGPLVPPYEIPGLFEPFRRLATTERRADHVDAPPGRGAGLGLSIVRSVTDAHGGHVDASPRSDGGLTVQVRLPAALERPTTNNPSRHRHPPNCRPAAAPSGPAGG